MVADPYSIPCTDEEWEIIKYWLLHGPPIAFPVTLEWIEEDGKMGPVTQTIGKPRILGEGLEG